MVDEVWEEGRTIVPTSILTLSDNAASNQGFTRNPAGWADTDREHLETEGDGGGMKGFLNGAFISFNVSDIDVADFKVVTQIKYTMNAAADYGTATGVKLSMQYIAGSESGTLNELLPDGTIFDDNPFTITFTGLSLTQVELNSMAVMASVISDGTFEMQIDFWEVEVTYSLVTKTGKDITETSCDGKVIPETAASSCKTIVVNTQVQTVSTVRPGIADGTPLEWTVVGTAIHYEAVDDDPEANSADWISSTTVNGTGSVSHLSKLVFRIRRNWIGLITAEGTYSINFYHNDAFVVGHTFPIVSATEGAYSMETATLNFATIASPGTTEYQINSIPNGFVAALGVNAIECTATYEIPVELTITKKGITETTPSGKTITETVCVGKAI
jgi:hypothetical protein